MKTRKTIREVRIEAAIEAAKRGGWTLKKHEQRGPGDESWRVRVVDYLSFSRVTGTGFAELRESMFVSVGHRGAIDATWSWRYFGGEQHETVYLGRTAIVHVLGRLGDKP